MLMTVQKPHRPPQERMRPSSRTLTLLPVLLILLMALARGTAAPVDWEAALADAQRGETECLYLTEGKRTAEERRRFINWIIQEFPGSAVAAQFEREKLDALAELMKVTKGHIAGDAPALPDDIGLVDGLEVREEEQESTKYSEMTAAVTAFVRQYPGYVSRYPTVHLLRVVQSPGATDQEKRAAFTALAPLLRPGTPAFDPAKQALQTLPVPEKERYALARDIAERCGTAPAVRAFHLAFLQAYCRTCPPAEAVTACERYLERYGDRHPEGHAARRLLLQLGGAASAEKLAAFNQQDHDTDAVIEKAFFTAADALEAKEYARAQQLLSEVMNRCPAFQTADNWRELLKKASLILAVPAGQLPILRLAVERGPGSGVEETAVTLALERQPWTAAAGLLAVYCANETLDPLAKRALCEKLLHDERVRAEPSLWIAVNWGAGEALDRLMLADSAANYLYTVGQRGWNLDRPLALRALRRAAEISPTSKGGISAGWLAAFFAGEQGYALSPLARVYPFPASRELPAPPLPALDSRPECAVAGEVITPVKQNREENLVAGQPPLLPPHGDAGMALAVDGKAETAWKPAALPARLTVPLTRTATVRQITLTFTQPAYCLVALLDRTGRVLAQYERDWSFQDYRRVANYWPPAALTFTVLPVDGVRFVQVTVYEFREGNGGLQELAVYSTPYAARATHLLEPAALPAGAKSVLVRWQAEEPAATVTYSSDLESSRHCSNARRANPWWKRLDGRRYGVEFYGDNLSVKLNYVGIFQWQIDEGPPSTLEQRESALKEYTLAKGLPPGRHILWCSRQGFPPRQDQPGAGGNLELPSASVQGKSRVRLAIRFATGAEWGSWLGPLPAATGSRVPAPAGATRYQVKIDFDNRELLGQQTGSVRELAVTPGPDPGAGVPALVEETGFRFSETLEEAVKLLAGRDVVVTYAKIGTPAEYDAAQALAEKAGLYLVSDDLAFQSGGSVPVVVGTPLNHRYARLVLGIAGAWNDPGYLNNPNGIVRVFRYADGKPWLVCAIGETADAAVRAAQRLTRALPAYTPPAEPFRTFPADTLELVYAWQFHPDRPAVRGLALRLGVGDRRSVQFGLAANRELADLRVTCGPLRSAAGQQLPAPLVRWVGYYDYAPEFGDLRLPNVLVPAPRLPMPANTADGIWLTLQTPRDAVPGIYQTTVTVSSGAYTQTFPLQVTVEPVRLAEAPRASFGSFSSAPTHWFNEEPRDCETAMRARAADEADHGFNVISAAMRVTTRDQETPVAPVRWALAGGEEDDELAPDIDDGSLLKGLKEDDAAKPGDPAPAATLPPPAPLPMKSLTWEEVTAKETLVGKQAVYYVDFGRAVTVRECQVSLVMHRDSRLILGWLAADGTWRESAPQAPGRNETLPEEGFGDVSPMTIVFRLNGTTAQYFRLRTHNGVKYTVRAVAAYTDMTRKWPYTIDFAGLERQLEIYDSVYREKGLPLPTLTASAVALQSTFDKTVFAEQLAARLRATGRLERFILTIGDEPGRIEQWADTARPFRAGGLRTMTCHSGNYPNIADAVGVMGPWCPNYQHNVQRPFFRERQQAGDQVWWYCCGVPATQLTGRPLDNLAFFWMTAKWRFDGGLSYASQDMNPALHQLPFRYEYGLVHRYVYQPDGSILDTTRRELEGEGIQDYMLIACIRDKVAALRQAQQTARAEELEGQLNAIFEQVVPYRYGYAGTADTWYRGRQALYDLAISAGKP